MFSNDGLRRYEVSGTVTMMSALFTASSIFFHGKAIHGSLQRTDRINLGNDHAGTSTTQGSGRAFADVTITGNHGDFSSHHHIVALRIASTSDSLQPYLLSNLDLVTESLDVDRRQWQFAIVHALNKAVNTGRGFL